MSEIDALKSDWQSTYLLLSVHLLIATVVFCKYVGNKLVKAGVYSRLSQAVQHTIYTYALSSIIILAISYPVLSIVFRTNEPFDILLLPMYYQWLGRIILTPVSIISNRYILKYFNKDNVNFRRDEVFRIVRSSEKQLFLVNLSFIIFYF